MPAQFAMVVTPPSIPPAPRAEDVAGPDAELAARVASGPGFWTEWLAELDRRGLLEELLAGDVIARALREAPAGHKYDRVLTAKMTVICVLVACLFPGRGLRRGPRDRVRPAGPEPQARCGGTDRAGVPAGCSASR